MTNDDLDEISLNKNLLPSVSVQQLNSTRPVMRNMIQENQASMDAATVNDMGRNETLISLKKSESSMAPGEETFGATARLRK